MITEILIFFITSLIVYVFYSHKRIKDSFRDNGVNCLPGIPLFGNIYKSSMLKRHMLDDIFEVYNAYPDDKYVGYIEGMTPIIMIRDPEIIKTVTVKDFDHFVDHRRFFPDNEELFGGSVFAMQGDKWRDMRTTLSPAFTGAKMRQMMPFMEQTSTNIVQYLKESRPSDDVVNISDLMRRYTNDVIASAGFGLQVNSIKDKDNEFYMLGQDLFKFNLWQKMYLFWFSLFPTLTNWLGFQLFSKKIRDFFYDIVNSTMEYRRQNNVERPDMIQLLMEASKGTLKATTDKEANIGFATVEEGLKPHREVRKWTNKEIVGQVFIFFAAGYESSSSALIMCAHELAINPDIQEKLYQELRSYQEKNGKLTYDGIGQLKYLDAVFNETLRKWSAAIILDRVATRDYELPPPRSGARPYRLKKGDTIYNSVNAIHMDPKYYPDPEKFDPDRFSEENKHRIQPFTYQPFGLGPRNCIGSRFAILELKVLLYYFLLDFKLVKCDRTLDPIVLDPSDFNIRVNGGSWIKLENRV